MNSKKIDIIKIGGSVITNKGEYRSLRKKQLSLICKEISKWDIKCIIVHGAGSFGHIIAKQYSIHLGFSYQEQMKGIFQIRKDMTELSEIVVNSLVEEGVKALSFQTSAIISENKSGYDVNFNSIKKALTLDLTPVLAGDIIFTEKEGFRILSGDTLANILANNFEINRVIFISDIDGIYIRNKDTGEDELATSLSKDDLDFISISILQQSDSNDVTGDMKGKISAIKSLLEQVSEVIVINGNYPKRLTSIQNSENFIGTILIAKKST